MHSPFDPGTYSAGIKAPRPQKARPRLGLVIGYACLMSVTIGYLYTAPREDANVAVLVSPWSPASQATDLISQADGRVVASARWPFVIVATSKSTTFVQHLYQSGAWFVFDAGLIAGCTESSTRNASS
ncbi:hypothetical protein MMA231_03916 (plasmid) [Asticcacaulis sp. MM231]